MTPGRVERELPDVQDAVRAVRSVRMDAAVGSDLLRERAVRCPSTIPSRLNRRALQLVIAFVLTLVNKGTEMPCSWPVNSGTGPSTVCV